MYISMHSQHVSVHIKHCACKHTEDDDNALWT